MPTFDLPEIEGVPHLLIEEINDRLRRIRAGSGSTIIRRVLGGGSGGPPAAASPGPFIRVLLLKNLTVMDSCAEHQYIFLPESSALGTGRRIVGVLRTAISADLTVRFRNLTASGSMTITIPAATPVNTPVELDITDVTFADKDVIAPDVLASDGSMNPQGIAALTLEWTP